jgi:S-adenosylmethionine synthetase
MSEMSKMILADTFHCGKMGTMKKCIKSLACAPRAYPWGFSFAKNINQKDEEQPMSRIITCEQVSDGHPDKICDQIADAIVTDCLAHDKNSRVAIECLFKDSHLIIAGELTSKHRPDYAGLAWEVLKRIGYEDAYLQPFPGNLDIGIMVREQSPDIALGVDKGGAGDQGIMYGYATNETPEMLPLPFAVATKFLKVLKNHPSKMFKPDAKAQVSFDYDTGRITTFLCSVQHSPDVEVSDFRHIIESLMVLAASEYGLNGDFEKLVNPTGRFVIGGPVADCGVTGRKLACDTYGGVGHIGGGAMSGKDPTKVDRSAAYAARKIARDIVRAGYADKCEVSIAYAIGKEDPVSVTVDCFGTEYQSKEFIDAFVKDSYDLTPRGLIDGMELLDVDYNLVSSYGHFGKPELPWEQ